MSTPSSWQQTQLGPLVADYRRGISYDSSTIHEEDGSGRVAYMTLKSFAVGGGHRSDGLKFFSGRYKDADLLAPGDIVIANTDLTPTCSVLASPTLVPSSFAGRPATCSHHVSRLRLSDAVLPSFLFHWLASPAVRRQIPRLARGTTVRNLDRDGFLKLGVALPPLGEQKKIAAILSSVDDAIAASQAIIDQLGVVKNAMMAELLTRGLPGRHARFKMTEIGEVPEGWTTARYGDLAAPVAAAIQSGPFGSELKHSEFVDDGHLVIGIDNVLDGRFSVGSNHRITPAKFNELRRFEARPHDLLITVMATVGRCCVVPQNIEPAIITKHIYRLTVDRSRANPYFLMYCLYGLKRLADEVRGSAQGLTRPGLNKSLLLPLRFPLPPPREQDEIVAVLETFDRRLEAERRSLPDLRSVKAALMSVLLTGEVRVKGDEVVA